MKYEISELIVFGPGGRRRHHQVGEPVGRAVLVREAIRGLRYRRRHP